MIQDTIAQHETGDQPSVWTPTRLTVAIAMAVAGVAVTFRAWSDIVGYAWNDPENTQILLAPAVVAWLIATRWPSLRDMPVRHTWIGPLVILLGMACDLAGFPSTLAVWHLGAVLVVTGCVLSVTGIELLRRAWPAFIILLFLIPVPGRVRQPIAIPLQRITAAAAQNTLQMFGFEVFRSANYLEYNGHAVEVAEACNGMRMMFSLILASFAFAFAMPLTAPMRIVVIALSPVAAVACNIIRVVPTIYVFGHFSNTTAHLFHDLSGWAMIVVAFMLLWGLVRLLDWAEVPVMTTREEQTDIDPRTTPAVAGGV